jgi:hypothetical protein
MRTGESKFDRLGSPSGHGKSHRHQRGKEFDPHRLWHHYSLFFLIQV